MDEFKPGLRFCHNKWGMGTLLEITPDNRGYGPKYTIILDSDYLPKDIFFIERVACIIPEGEREIPEETAAIREEFQRILKGMGYEKPYTELEGYMECKSSLCLANDERCKRQRKREIIAHQREIEDNRKERNRMKIKSRISATSVMKPTVKELDELGYKEFRFKVESAYKSDSTYSHIFKYDSRAGFYSLPKEKKRKRPLYIKHSRTTKPSFLLELELEEEQNAVFLRDYYHMKDSKCLCIDIYEEAIAIFQSLIMTEQIREKCERAEDRTISVFIKDKDHIWIDLRKLLLL